MICERCGEVTETFMTEGYGELCEACQRAVQEESQPNPPRRTGRAEES
ncbi:MAG TPA: hypothetical protein VLA99_03365 [Nitrospiraceae bacterium]|nr:hypothetical protein [Nitrospiraceae bacterium]